MAIVLTEDVPDNCPSRTLIGACFGWSTCIAMSLTEGACFLMPKGRSFWESTEFYLLPLPGLDTSICFGLLSFCIGGPYGVPLGLLLI